MLNPRLPFLAGGSAILALALAQNLHWSSAVGFLVGWAWLVTLAVARRWGGAFVQSASAHVTQVWSRLVVVAHTRLSHISRSGRDNAHRPFLDGV